MLYLCVRVCVRVCECVCEGDRDAVPVFPLCLFLFHPLRVFTKCSRPRGVSYDTDAGVTPAAWGGLSASGHCPWGARAAGPQSRDWLLSCSQRFLV